MSSNEALRRAGDIIQVANPIIGLGIALHAHTQEQYIAQYLESMAVVGVGKFSGDHFHYNGSRRPDGTSHRGMPSGHTASAWSAAANTRNGYLYTGAALTGISRITNKRHYWYQVLVSIVASEGVAFLNKKLQGKVWLDARFDNNKYSFNVRYLV